MSSPAATRPLLETAVRVSVALLLALQYATPITGGDLWWHLDAGRWMLEHGRLLEEEIRSFTAPGAPWVNHEWLYQVCLAWINETFGVAGLFVTKVALVTLLFLLLGGVLPLRHLLASAICVIVLAPVVQGGLEPRPHLVAGVLLAATLLLLQRPRPWQLLAFPLLVALWSNLHASALVVGGAIVLHLVICAWRMGRSRAALWHLLSAVATGLAIFANPLGLELPGLLLDHREHPWPHAYIGEWQAPEPYPELFLGLGAVVLAGWWSGWVRLPAATLLLGAFFLVLSTQANRFLFEAFVVLHLPLALLAARAIDAARDAGRRLGWAALLLAAVASTWLYGAPLTATLQQWREVPLSQRLVPRATTAMLVEISQRAGRELNVFNQYFYGGYVAYQGQGRLRVFIDGRVITVFPESTMLHYAMARTRRDHLMRLQALHGIDALLLRRSDRPRLIQPDDPAWILAAYDSASELYVHAGLASRLGLVRIPYDPDSLYIGARDLDVESAIAATHGLLEVEPANALAWRQLGNLELERAREDPARLRVAFAHLLRSQALLDDPSTGLLLVVARLMQEPAYDPGRDLLGLFEGAGDNPELLLTAVEVALNTGHPGTADGLLAAAKPALLRQLAAYPATWRLQAVIDRALQRPEQAQTIEALLGPGG